MVDLKGATLGKAPDRPFELGAIWYVRSPPFTLTTKRF